MEPINTSFLTAPFQRPSHYSIFKRIVNLILVVVGCIACINLWLISSEQSLNWHSKQANQLGVSLSSLSGNILISSLLENDSEKLSQQLNYIAADPHVAGVSLFDNKGRMLADNNSATSVIAAYKLNDYIAFSFRAKYHLRATNNWVLKYYIERKRSDGLS